jgi:quercetin 2,3-dioxygenase
MNQTEAKIFLATQRGKTETSWFRSFHTFNFGKYFNENKAPFEQMRVFNDNTLAAGKGMKMQVEKPTAVFILPLVGGIEFKNNTGYHDFLEVGKVQVFSAEEGSEYEVLNPYESEQNDACLINYLEIWIENDTLLSSKTEQIKIDIEKQNELLTIFSQDEIIVHFGKFTGRQEAVYSLRNSAKKLFVFVIEGAFEVDNKLMETRDGLALWNIAEIEMEALSDQAMILIFEF